MDRKPRARRQALPYIELVIRWNVVSPMYAPRGKQRVEDGIKSERRPVTGRIALQDLGHSERKQTYTQGLRLQ
jgi:hypothetical protein